MHQTYPTFTASTEGKSLGHCVTITASSFVYSYASITFEQSREKAISLSETPQQAQLFHILKAKKKGPFLLHLHSERKRFLTSASWGYTCGHNWFAAPDCFGHAINSTLVTSSGGKKKHISARCAGLIDAVSFSSHICFCFCSACRICNPAICTVFVM